MKYEVIQYDVIGNKRDGFMVNEAFHTAKIIDIDPMKHRGIIQELKKVVGLKAGLKITHFIISGDPDYSLYIDYENQELGRIPVCELRREEKVRYCIRTNKDFTVDSFRSMAERHDPDIWIDSENNPRTFWIKTDKTMDEIYEMSKHIVDVIQSKED